MPTPKRKPAQRTTADHPPLDAWLTKHHARFLWRTAGEAGGAPAFEAWAIGANLLLVALYMPTTDSGGWGLFMEPSMSNDITKTLADADALIAARNG